MSDDEKESYSCYNCNKVEICGIFREMNETDDKYNKSIEGLNSILANNCKEFDLHE